MAFIDLLDAEEPRELLSVASEVKLEELDIDTQHLIVAACKVREYAYCPYSKFSVGAAAAWEDSEVIDVGANVENSSYGNSICAERVAVSKGISRGQRRLKAVAVIGEMSESLEFVAPCGICRQFLFEFGKNTVIYLAKPTSAIKVIKTNIKSLLPLGFRL